MNKTDIVKLRDRLYAHALAKQFNFRVTTNMLSRINTWSKRLKVSRSDFIRMAILRFEDELKKTKW